MRNYKRQAEVVESEIGYFLNRAALEEIKENQAGMDYYLGRVKRETAKYMDILQEWGYYLINIEAGDIVKINNPSYGFNSKSHYKIASIENDVAWVREYDIVRKDSITIRPMAVSTGKLVKQ